jgi:hypothetical protein
MRSFDLFKLLLLLVLLLGMGACSVVEPVDGDPAGESPIRDDEDPPAGEDPPGDEEPPPVELGDGLRIAALDYYIDDLNDPEALEKYARAELLIVGPWQFWDANLDLSVLRAANPEQKIVAYFRTKCVREEWVEPPGRGAELPARPVRGRPALLQPHHGGRHPQRLARRPDLRLHQPQGPSGHA